MNLVEDHFIDRPFRAHLSEIEIHAGGQHQAEGKQCGILPGLSLDRKIDFWHFSPPLKQPLT
jgi:hypothetical protein